MENLMNFVHLTADGSKKADKNSTQSYASEEDPSQGSHNGG